MVTPREGLGVWDIWLKCLLQWLTKAVEFSSNTAHNWDVPSNHPPPTSKLGVYTYNSATAGTRDGGAGVIVTCGHPAYPTVLHRHHICGVLFTWSFTEEAVCHASNERHQTLTRWAVFCDINSVVYVTELWAYLTYSHAQVVRASRLGYMYRDLKCTGSDAGFH